MPRTTLAFAPPLLAAILLAIALPAAALTPPAPGHVSDAEALRLLRGVYGEPVSLTEEWKAKPERRQDDARAPSARKVCADTGASAWGPRQIAICSSLDDAGHAEPGEVDLFLILDPRGVDTRARIGAQERRLQSGGWGTPGEVGLVEIGSHRTAFALHSGYSQMGWSTESVQLYQADDDRFVERLSFATHLDNGGACDPDEDRGCRAKSVSLDCTLHVDPATADRGFYALGIDVAGERGGRKVKRSIPAPFDGERYVPDPKALARDGCDEGF